MYRLLLIILCCFQLSASAQTVRGNIMGKDSLPLAGVFIQNIQSKIYTVSNGDGYFSISASPLDTLFFRAPGHVSISFRAFSLPAIIYLPGEIVQLTGVEIIKKSHKADSIALRQDYGKNFNFRRPKFKEVVILGFPGIALNIHQFYRVLKLKHNKQQMTFKRRLQEYEQEKYVSQFFTPELVNRYSGLEGDSLKQFILQHPPSYQFMKDASTYDLLLYIRQAAERFRKGG